MFLSASENQTFACKSLSQAPDNCFKTIAGLAVFYLFKEQDNDVRRKILFASLQNSN